MPIECDGTVLEKATVKVACLIGSVDVVAARRRRQNADGAHLVADVLATEGDLNERLHYTAIWAVPRSGSCRSMKQFVLRRKCPSSDDDQET